jgi:hypothetical protein
MSDEPIAESAKPGYKAGNRYIDRSYQEFYGEIKRSIEGLRKFFESQAVNLENEVQLIIKSDSKDQLLIEHTLDSLLSGISLGLNPNSFNKLLDYYSKIDKKSADFYRKEYETLKKS